MARSTALLWIVKEAKKLRRQFPHRFKQWKDYVAQASAIYASKHGGKSPVGKKHKRVGNIGKGRTGPNVHSVQPMPGPQYLPGRKGSHRIGAVKYLERGEKHNARATIVRVNRTKGGQFKKFTHVNGINTPSQTHVDKNRITANIQVGSVNSRILQAIQDKVYWIEVLEKNIKAAEVARSAASKRRDRKTKATMVDNIKRWKDLLRAAKKELTALKRNLR